jgi:RNA polymerase sigma factor (sigma-70 family)
LIEPRPAETSSLDPDRLMDERSRLLRYCTRVIGSAEMAEDMVQEALLTAWQCRERLRDGESWQAWLTGITRNICLRWLRRRSTDRQRFVETGAGASGALLLDTAIDTSLPDLNDLLEQHEIGRLLDRALTTLPRRTHDLLIDRYIYDLPLAEIAGRRGVREETAAVQLHRSRLALRKALTAPQLREESIALGLLEPETACTQETRIWCPRCGKRRLNGYFGPLDKWHEKQDGPDIVKPKGFFLSCPDCDTSHDCFVQMVFHPKFSYGDLLNGVKGFKPALNRINQWWREYVDGAVATGQSDCQRCGLPRRVQFSVPDDYKAPELRGEKGLFTECERCGALCQISACQIALNTVAGQQFWREHSRLRMLPYQERASANGPILVTRIESATGRAALEVAYSLQTMQIVGTERS